MRMRKFGIGLAAAALVLAGCGGDEGGGDDAGGDGGQTQADADVTVATADSDFGEILVDGEGMTLYVFDNDSEGTSNCTGDCAETWPPLVGTAAAGDGADSALLGSIEREDGSMQVTYDGQPLYYFAPDEAEGDTNGQAVGDVWWVVGPDGAKITDAAAGSAGSDEDDYGY